MASEASLIFLRIPTFSIHKASLNFYWTLWRLTVCHVQSRTEQISYFHPQYPLPGQCGRQHVSGRVRVGWRLLPHGHPLLGHGRRGGDCHRSRRSHHGHFGWVTEKTWAQTSFKTPLCWVTGRSGGSGATGWLTCGGTAEGDCFTEQSSESEPLFFQRKHSWSY